LKMRARTAALQMRLCSKQITGGVRYDACLLGDDQVYTCSSVNSSRCSVIAAMKSTDVDKQFAL
jgi:hypothetical protein